MDPNQHEENSKETKTNEKKRVRLEVYSSDEGSNKDVESGEHKGYPTSSSSESSSSRKSEGNVDQVDVDSTRTKIIREGSKRQRRSAEEIQIDSAQNRIDQDIENNRSEGPADLTNGEGSLNQTSQSNALALEIDFDSTRGEIIRKEKEKQQRSAETIQTDSAHNQINQDIENNRSEGPADLTNSEDLSNATSKSNVDEVDVDSTRTQIIREEIKKQRHSVKVIQTDSAQNQVYQDIVNNSSEGPADLTNIEGSSNQTSKSNVDEVDVDSTRTEIIREEIKKQQRSVKVIQTDSAQNQVYQDIENNSSEGPADLTNIEGSSNQTSKSNVDEVDVDSTRTEIIREEIKKQQRSAEVIQTDSAQNQVYQDIENNSSEGPADLTNSEGSSESNAEEVNVDSTRSRIIRGESKRRRISPETIVFESRRSIVDELRSSADEIRKYSAQDQEYQDIENNRSEGPTDLTKSESSSSQESESNADDVDVDSTRTRIYKGSKRQRRPAEAVNSKSSPESVDIDKRRSLPMNTEVEKFPDSDVTINVDNTQALAMDIESNEGENLGESTNDDKIKRSTPMNIKDKGTGGFDESDEINKMESSLKSIDSAKLSDRDVQIEQEKNNEQVKTDNSSPASTSHITHVPRPSILRPTTVTRKLSTMFRSSKKFGHPSQTKTDSKQNPKSSSPAEAESNLLFYTFVYLLFLVTYFMFLLYIALRTILNNNSSTGTKLMPHLSCSPQSVELTGIPLAEHDYPLIWYRNGEASDYKTYITALDELLEGQRLKNLNTSVLGPCGQRPYGYGECPCVIVKINNQKHWSAKPLRPDSPKTKEAPAEVRKWIETYSEKYWLHCRGHHNYDMEHIGSIKYYPNPPGIDSLVFPLDKDRPPPLLAVQLCNFTLGISIAVECKLWYETSVSSIAFMLFVSSKDKDLRNSSDWYLHNNFNQT